MTYDPHSTESVARFCWLEWPDNDGHHGAEWPFHSCSKSPGHSDSHACECGTSK